MTYRYFLIHGGSKAWDRLYRLDTERGHYTERYDGPAIGWTPLVGKSDPKSPSDRDYIYYKWMVEGDVMMDELSADEASAFLAR